MFRDRLIRVLTAAAMSGSLMAGTLASSASAVTHPTQLTVLATPASVSNHATAGFDVTVHNSSAKTFTIVGVGAPTPTGSTFLGSSPSQGSCSVKLFACNIGPIGPGASASVTVFYRTPSTGTSMKLVVAEAAAGYKIVDAQAKTATVTLSNDPNAVSTFITPGNEEVGTDPNLNPDTNPQSTSLVAPEDYIPVSLSEQAPTTYPCPTEGAGCLTQWSIVNVNNGATYPQGFPITITVLKSFIGQDLNDGDEGDNYADDLNFIHVKDDNSVEYISAEDGLQCTFGEGGTPDSLPCLTETQDATTITAVIWVTTNGRIGGY